MSEPARFDVVVAGLGPAGASAAAMAAKAGFSVLALERKVEAGAPVQCAEFVPAVIGMEVPELSRVRLQSIGAMRTYVEAERPDDTPNFPGQMIDRRAFDAMLVEKAKSAGADCRFGANIRAVGPNGEVVLADGAVIAARVLIGADGPRSAVAAALHGREQPLVETRQIRAPLLKPHDATDIFLSAEIAGGYGWLFPRGAEANLGLGVRPADKARLKSLLEGLRQRLIDEGRIGEDILGHTGGPIPVGGMVAPAGRIGGTLTLLAGDAAGLTNPVTGAGISSAAISGGLAGDAAASWLGGDENAAEDYAEELTFLFDRALDRARRHRERIEKTYAAGGPSPQNLRDGWIAYPQYWAA